MLLPLSSFKKETDCEHLYSSMYNAILCDMFRSRLEKHRRKAWTAKGNKVNFSFLCVSVMRVV